MDRTHVSCIASSFFTTEPLGSPIFQFDLGKLRSYILNDIYILSGSWNSNILVTWSEEPTHWKRSWYWERLRARGEEGNRGWDGWMVSLTNAHEFEQIPGVVKNRGAWGAAVHGVSKSRTWLSDWATTVLPKGSVSFSFLTRYIQCSSLHICRTLQAFSRLGESGPFPVFRMPVYLKKYKC